MEEKNIIGRLSHLMIHCDYLGKSVIFVALILLFELCESNRYKNTDPFKIKLIGNIKTKC